MSKSILITYTIQNSSNWEVADIVAKEMKQNGAKVDILPMRKVRSLEAYQAVVLGAPLYMFKWHKGIHHFLTKHQSALDNLPVAIFVVGSRFIDGEESKEGAREQIDEVLGKSPWLKPISLEIFDLNFDTDTPPFPFNVFQKKTSTDEMMDWTAIKKWAGNLVKKLS